MLTCYQGTQTKPGYRNQERWSGEAKTNQHWNNWRTDKNCTITPWALATSFKWMYRGVFPGITKFIDYLFPRSSRKTSRHHLWAVISIRKNSQWWENWQTDTNCTVVYWFLETYFKDNGRGDFGMTSSLLLPLRNANLLIVNRSATDWCTNLYFEVRKTTYMGVCFNWFFWGIHHQLDCCFQRCLEVSSLFESSESSHTYYLYIF